MFLSASLLLDVKRRSDLRTRALTAGLLHISRMLREELCGKPSGNRDCVFATMEHILLEMF